MGIRASGGPTKMDTAQNEKNQTNHKKQVFIHYGGRHPKREKPEKQEKPEKPGFQTLRVG